MTTKFRAWHKEAKRMFYSNKNLAKFEFRDNGWQATIWDSDTEMHKISREKMEPMHRLIINNKNSILMQSTGNEDKGKIEVFAGDIIQTSDGFLMEVVFSGLKFYLIHKYTDTSRWSFDKKGKEVYGTEIEEIDIAEIYSSDVIGNIFEGLTICPHCHGYVDGQKHPKDICPQSSGKMPDVDEWLKRGEDYEC